MHTGTQMQNECRMATQWEGRNIHFQLNDIRLYFLLLAFMQPEGLYQIHGWKLIGTAWLWIAVCVVWAQFFLEIFQDKFKLDWKGIWIGAYFALALLITIVIQHGISEGFQQLVAFPSVLVCILVNFRKTPQKLLNAVINILLVSLIANLFLFRDYFAQIYHLTVLGHVQVIAQIGLVAVFASALNLILFHTGRVKSFLTIGLAMIVMLTADAESALLAALFLMVAWVCYKCSAIFRRLFCIKAVWIVTIMLAFNAFLVAITAISGVLIRINPAFDFNGRSYIWQIALNLASQKSIFGYGMYGILIKPFWVAPDGGFNYAHNQLMQNLIDGGIVLSIVFIGMMYAVALTIDRIKHQKCRMLSNIILAILMFVMCFESPTIYCHMYLFFGIALSLPKVLNDLQADGRLVSKRERNRKWVF